MNLNKLNKTELCAFSSDCYNYLDNIEQEIQDSRLREMLDKLSGINQKQRMLRQEEYEKKREETKNETCRKMLVYYNMLYHIIKGNTFYPDKKRQAYANRMMKLFIHTPYQLERLKRTEQIQFLHKFSSHIQRFDSSKIEATGYICKYSEQYDKLEWSYRVINVKEMNKQTFSRNKKLIIETILNIYNYLQSANQIYNTIQYKSCLSLMESSYKSQISDIKRKEKRKKKNENTTEINTAETQPVV